MVWFGGAAEIFSQDASFMNELVLIAAELGDFCRKRGWRSCVIGGFAVQHWGEPRMTMDVDLSLLTGFGEEEVFVDELLLHYAGRLPDAKGFALQNRVLLIKHSSGVGIDIALAALPFEECVVDRSVTIEAEPGCAVRICTADDLVVMKAFANRDIDWHDVRGVIVRQGPSKMDWCYIQQELAPLCEAKEQPEILDRLLSLKRQLNA
jgi:hypothetical protein